MTLPAKVVQKIFKLRDECYSIREIAKKLNVAKSTVERYIKKGRRQMITQSIVIRKISPTPVDDYEEGSMTWELDKIISEVTNKYGRAAIIRMVRPYITDPKCKDYGLSKLEEALTLGHFSPHNKELILRNWAGFVGFSDIIL